MADSLQTSAVAATPETTAQVSEFDQLLQKQFRPKTDQAKSAVEIAVRTLAQQALASTHLISGDALKAIEAMIAELDKRLSEQLNLILHNPEFQKLEGTWRGLHHLVFKTEVDDFLRISVLNVKKEEALRDFKKNPEAKWDQGTLFKKVYTGGYSQWGAAPFGTLIGDYYCDHTPQDVAFLDGMGKIAAAAHAPFIAAPSPKLMDMETWQELPDHRDLAKKFQADEYAGWRALRGGENSRYIGLCLPRFLARLPYGARTSPVAEFDFEEDTDGAEHDKYTWANSAFAMAANITRSFKLYGWCASIRGIESGGTVEGLPLHTFKTDDGKADFKCPTEVLIDDRREKELADLGLMPILYKKHSEEAAFIGAQTLNKPSEYYDADATANANLSARLPYIFATCRFAHYLKSIVRDKIGSFKERIDMERWLNNWIANYVTTDPGASQEVKARYPLAQAEVTVADVEGNPGYYAANFYLRPHFQLEGLTASLRLVTKLPSVKSGG